MKVQKKKNPNKKRIALTAAAVLVLILVVASFAYLNDYYHADGIDVYTSDAVTMKKIDGGYFFDGPGTENALIFYPGAKVETGAYASLMTRLAENGIDCFLADMPFRIAFFGKNTADKFMSEYSYKHWIGAGHSLGGVVMSSYIADHSEAFDTLVLLASYPNSKLPEGIRICSIYGSEDTVLSMDAYEKAKSNWPDSPKAMEYCIEGGNHAQYANYGPQSGDGTASISRIEQQEKTAEIIFSLIVSR